MSSKKRGQVRELQDKLNDPDIEQKQEAIRRIIDAMTRGKDVSMLFMDVIKNMQTQSLQLKKLIYLYVMNYAKSHPDVAILGVNTFRKDAVNKNNPFLRGLAVRTMGCIRIKDITIYLCDPLKKALKDEDAYVRKTGVLCVPKLYEIAPELIEEEGFLKLLENLLNDGNATVVSNAIASLSICSEIKGQPLMKLTDHLVQKLLTAINDCNEWGVVYILDTLSTYIPKNPTEAQNVMERVSSKLNHTNSAVALSAIRLIIKYMDYLTHPESIRTYNNKISAPLITMISRENQISYLVLKTINLVLQKRPLLLPKELKIFFVNYHDPLYVKLEKLEVLSKIANNENILMILHELKECVQEVDVEFVRRAVRTMGRCAIKLEKMADKCIQCLWESLKTKIPYVVQEAVIVIRDIFRKYPNKYERLLTDICENLKSLDDPEAKASIVWIIGEYVHLIENADEILATFAENFKDEPDVVQQQILISCMKLFLHRPEDGTEILKDLLKYITKECENPDLRDRGFIYWRLVSTNPELAKKVVLSERPLLSEQSYTLETELLEKLIQNIGCLASVYGKQPEEFVKRLKDNANAREKVDEDQDQLLDEKPEQVQNQEEPKENVNFMNEQREEVPEMNNQVQISYIPPPPPPPKKVENLLQMQEPEKKVEEKPKGVESLLDLGENTEKQYVTTKIETEIRENRVPHQYATQVHNNQADINFFGKIQQEEVNKNIVIPFVEVVDINTTSRDEKYSGLSIKAAFQRSGSSMFLSMILENKSNTNLEDFAIKLNANAFKLQQVQIPIEGLKSLAPNEVQEVKIDLNNGNNETELQGYPYTIDCALKVNDDVFIFKIPCSMSVAMVSDSQLSLEDYKQTVGNTEAVKKQETLNNENGLEQFITKLTNNSMKMVFRKDGDIKQMMSFICQLTNHWKLAVDVIFNKGDHTVTIQMTVPREDIGKYFHQALAMIVNL